MNDRCPFGFVDLLIRVVQTCERVAATGKTSLVYMVFESREDRASDMLVELLTAVLEDAEHKAFINDYAGCLVEGIEDLSKDPENLEYADIVAASAIPELHDQWCFVMRETQHQGEKRNVRL